MLRYSAAFVVSTLLGLVIGVLQYDGHWGAWGLFGAVTLAAFLAAAVAPDQFYRGKPAPSRLRRR